MKIMIDTDMNKESWEKLRDQIDRSFESDSGGGSKATEKPVSKHKSEWEEGNAFVRSYLHLVVYLKYLTELKDKATPEQVQSIPEIARVLLDYREHLVESKRELFG